MRGSSLVIGGIVAALVISPTSGAASCGADVLHDWAIDGRVDGVYALACYQEAIDVMPADVRAYSNAADVIQRALTVAVRRGGASDLRTAEPAAAAPGSSLPVSLVLALGVAVVALTAGVLGVIRRRLTGRTHPRR